MAGTEPNGKNLASGIRLVHDELKALRGDIAVVLREASEDRRRADADRERSDRRFEFLVETMREEHKRTDARFRELVRGVLDVGRKILKKLDDHTTILDKNTELLKENTEILKENTGILKSIKRGMNGRTNGPGGNGRSRK